MQCRGETVSQEEAVLLNSARDKIKAVAEAYGQPVFTDISIACEFIVNAVLLETKVTAELALLPKSCDSTSAQSGAIMDRFDHDRDGTLDMNEVIVIPHLLD